MKDENIEEKYPHWKDALFGNHNAVANLRCAAEYVLWHLAYALIAVIGVVLVAAIKSMKFLSKLTGPFDNLYNKLRSVMRSDTVFKVAIYSYITVVILVVLAFVVVAAYHIYNNPVGSTIGFGIGIGIVVFTLGVIHILYEYGGTAKTRVARTARSAGEKAVETPGVRRVYGKCPVNISNQAPRWFEKLFPEE